MTPRRTATGKEASHDRRRRPLARLDLLLDRVLDGLHTDEDARQLNQILRTDADACRHYVSYVELHGRLCWGERGWAPQGYRRLDDPVKRAAERVSVRGSEVPSRIPNQPLIPHPSPVNLPMPRTPNPSIPPIIIHTSPALPLPSSLLVFPRRLAALLRGSPR